MHLNDFENKKPKLKLIDRWILSKLHKLVKQVTERFDKYDTSEAKKLTEQFFWHVFCDNYLELAKDRLYNKERGKEARKSAQYALYHTLLAMLKMLSPIVPHITEELYQAYYKKYEKTKSIHISDWPKYSKEMINEKVEKIGDAVVGIVSAVRKYKSDKNLSLKSEIKQLKVATPVDLTEVLKDIKGVTRAKDISVKKAKKLKTEVM